ncbi:hypothetical protein KAJ38_03030 [Candidatus Pacearchaeota archaeon]|nr:hypothetical protein [Candidatus Pacearchaeota archaeon]
MNKLFKGLKIAWKIIVGIWALSVVAAGLIFIVTLMYMFMNSGTGLYCGPDWVIMLLFGSLIYLGINMAFMSADEERREYDIRKGDDAFKEKLGPGKYKVIDKIHQQPTLFIHSHYYIVIKNIDTDETRRLSLKSWVYDAIEKGEILDGLKPLKPLGRCLNEEEFQELRKLKWEHPNFKQLINHINSCSSCSEKAKHVTSPYHR